MPRSFESLSRLVRDLHRWYASEGMRRRVIHDRSDPAAPVVVVVSFGPSEIRITVEDDVPIGRVYEALDQYAAILRRRHRETAKVRNARYASAN